MHLTTEAVRELAFCARIELHDEELPALTRDLNAIMDSLEPITHFELDEVEPTYHPIAGLVNVTREDVAKPCLTQQEALSNAPFTQDGQFKIPPILADAGGTR
ncbi:MAG: Asp-tRNA(Asn)/Glu-tRNA(Gln) amidotransferase subunit GatC [Coriobacteriales bacterium]|jgi:aspartyl-tRNA(Asn)/glutamyl-tRNA(Gln) amidotransferase subunit C|nr:Asp-tRNA(Asn)/Glu-tRNA(Gln) amidotransferase subunit GatC [Coriobacteriales bacterium]